MNPTLVQKQLRDNANDLQEFCKDLQSWGQEMKRKEASLVEPNSKHIKSAQQTARQPELKKVKKVRISEPTVTKKKSITDYNAWEQFDAETECGKIDDENFEESDLSDEYDDTKRDEAMVLKEKGNRFVKNQKWMDAIDCYSKAIDCYQYDPVYFANRALCYLKVEQMEKAIEDCTLSLKLDPTYVKAYQRRAAAREALNEFDSAQCDLQRVLTYEPNNKESKTALEKLCKKIEKCSEAQRPISKFNATRNQKAQINSNLNSKQNMITKSDVPLNTELKSTNKEVDCSKNLSFWPSGDDVILVKPTKKPPHLQSKKSLKRIPIIDVDSSVQKEKTQISSDSKLIVQNDYITGKEAVAVKDHVVERTEPTTLSEQSNPILKHIIENDGINKTTSVSNTTPFPNVHNNIFNLQTDDLKITEKMRDATNNAKSKATEKRIKQESTEDIYTKIIETHPPSIVTTKMNKDLKNFDNDIQKLNTPIQNCKEIFFEPKTSVQFYNSWKSLKDTNLKYQYLSRCIKPDILPSILRESLDSDTFSEFIKIFADQFIPKNDPLYQFLYHLTSVKRFSALTMFLSTNDKNSLWKIIDHLKENENIEKEKVDELIKKYEL